MPDICMCSGEGCPLKDKCYRSQAKPFVAQSYFLKPPFDGKECKYFWPLEGNEIRKKDKK